MRKILTAILLWAALCGAACCQEVAISGFGGSAVTLKPEWKYIQGPLAGANADITWPAKMEDGCRKPFDLGIRLNYAGIPNGIAGSRFGLQGLVAMPLFADCFELDIAAGLGLYTRPEERTGDPQNIFIGSYLNCAIDLGARYLLPLSDDRHTLLFGLTFVHNSNGYLYKPNKGLNYLQGEVGLRLTPPRMPDTLGFSSRYHARSAPFLYAALGASIPRHQLASNGTFYPAYTLQGGYRYAFHPSRGVALTLDATYNFADFYYYRSARLPMPTPLLIGTTLMYESFWGPFSLRVGMGAHLYKSNKDFPVYERVALHYHLADPRHSISVGLRAYYTHIDFIEWGYSFDIIKNYEF